MGVFSGTLSYARYFVEGEISQEMTREYLLERIKLYGIPELTVESEEEEVMGWACIENLLNTEFTFENVFFNEYILLAFRMDRWKIAPTLFKAHVIEAEKKFLEDAERTEMTKREKTILKDEVKARLKKKVLPNIAVYDLCWQPEKHLLRFWSHSQRINELMISHFEKTFELNLTPLSAFTLAEKTRLTSDEIREISQLEASSFSQRK